MQDTVVILSPVQPTRVVLVLFFSPSARHAMWKESLVARFTHRRSESLNAPLIPSRPLSTVTLDPVPESPLHGDPLDQHCERPLDVPDSPNSSSSPNSPSTNSPSGLPVTATSMDKKETPPSHVVPTLSDGALAQNALDIESIQLLGMRSVRSYLMEEIDTKQAAAPLSAYCFMTGFMSVLSLSSLPPPLLTPALAMQLPFLPSLFGVPFRQATLYKYVPLASPLADPHPLIASLAGIGPGTVVQRSTRLFLSPCRSTSPLFCPLVHLWRLCRPHR